MAKRRNASSSERTRGGPSAFCVWRIRQGYSLRALARRTRLSAPTLCRIEQGSPVSLRARIRLKDSLRLSMRALDGLLGPLQRPKRQPKAGRRHGWLHKWRLRHNVTLKDLAALTGLTPATIWRFEGGLVNPHKRTLRRIDAALSKLKRKQAPRAARRGKIRRGD